MGSISARSGAAPPWSSRAGLASLRWRNFRAWALAGLRDWGTLGAVIRPRISVNLAISADGKISSVERRSSGWTSARDHARLLELRRGVDALLVGKGTLDADRMTLTVPGQDGQPLRCVVSRSTLPDPAHPLFHRAGGPIHWLLTAAVDRQGPGTADCLLHQGCLAEFLKTLARDHGVQTIHCEGGGMLVRSLAELDAIDTLHLTLAGHTVFGGALAPTASGVPGDFLTASRSYHLVGFEPDEATGECYLTFQRVTASDAAERT